MLLSRRLLEALQSRREPAYRIAIRAGIHPATLSKLLHGAERVRPNDPRVIAIGAQFGLSPSACFARDERTDDLSDGLDVLNDGLRDGADRLAGGPDRRRAGDEHKPNQNERPDGH